MSEREPALPPLRDELVLHNGPPDRHGSPTWTLHDPASNRFFAIGWPGFEILSRWLLGDRDAIVGAVNRETTLVIVDDDIDAMTEFLEEQHLLQVVGGPARDRLARIRDRMHPGWLRRVVSSYLFFRIPLLRPQRFLAATWAWVAWLYTPFAAIALLLTAAASLYLGAQQWDVLLARLPQFASVEGAIWLAVALTVAKVVHEFGHAYTAYRHGCHVAGMGVAFLVLWPVLYTDTTDAWRLTSHRKRLQIAGAGMVAELGLASIAMLAWVAVPDGPGRDALLLLATSTWLMTLAVNLNPFMRFDGYFLLCDFLGEENLHERAFALGRWRLREFFLGLGDPPPEVLPAGLRRFLVAFAFGTWLYRLVLFLGIAVLVYHLFFKVLGIVLMLVEIWWFIARPVVRELGEWWTMRKRVRMNGHVLRTMLVLCATLALLVVPWGQEVSAPAVMQAEQRAIIEVPRPARVLARHALTGDDVAAGALLFELDAPDLRQRLAIASAEVAILDAEIQMGAVDDGLRERAAIAASEREQALQRVAGLADELERMRIRAPFAGRLTAVLDHAVAGAWLPASEPLAHLVAFESLTVVAYLTEDDLSRANTGANARFYPDDVALSPVDCSVEQVETTALRALDNVALASVYGGPVGVTPGPGEALIPDSATYRVMLTGCALAAARARLVTGHALIEAPPASLVNRAWRRMLGVFLRESGF